ncbi:hypothetical protein CEW46_23925 [Bacillus cereus]|nr:hypothetical protein CEW46_23925 [Bacillus cereus]
MVIRSLVLNEDKWVTVTNPGPLRGRKLLVGGNGEIKAGKGIPKHIMKKMTVSPSGTINDDSGSTPAKSSAKLPTPNKEFTDNVTKNTDKKCAELAKKHGMTTEEYKVAAQKKAQEMIDKSDIYIRVNKDTLSTILDQGFKTVHETGTSNGVNDSNYRQFLEKDVFGGDGNPPPVYGYFSDNQSGFPPSDKTKAFDARLEIYGDIAVKLKPETKDRSTVTFDDSMATVHNGRNKKKPIASIVPSPANNVDMNSVVGGYYGDPLTRDKIMKPQGTYVESQVYGGVTIDDIAEIQMKPHHKEGEDGTKFEQSGRDQFVFRQIAQKCRDHNIRLVDDKGKEVDLKSIPAPPRIFDHKDVEKAVNDAVDAKVKESLGGREVSTRELNKMRRVAEAEFSGAIQASKFGKLDWLDKEYGDFLEKAINKK